MKFELSHHTLHWVVSIILFSGKYKYLSLLWSCVTYVAWTWTLRGWIIIFISVVIMCQRPPWTLRGWTPDPRCHRSKSPWEDKHCCQPRSYFVKCFCLKWFLSMFNTHLCFALADKVIIVDVVGQVALLLQLGNIRLNRIPLFALLPTLLSAAFSPQECDIKQNHPRTVAFNPKLYLSPSLHYHCQSIMSI